MSDYRTIEVISKPIAADRQAAKRHYGVHPYFTRRPFNVVRSYILHYSRPGDTVLDPFGGSGVTAIEAWLENRHGIQNDLNPLANFIARGIVNLSRDSIGTYAEALEFLRSECERTLAELETANESEVDRRLKTVRVPKDVPLPANSDVKWLHDLFLPRQLAALAILQEAIARIRNVAAREAMLLALSATLAKLNRTFLSAEGRAASRGGSSIFSIYRYKVAKNPISLPLWPTFAERANNVLAAKKEIDRTIELKRNGAGWCGKFQCHNLDVLELPKAIDEKVDYIFTDPPYGGHISYIDLSTVWNAWLGIMPPRPKAQKEIIVGGDERHSEESYIRRLGASINTCVALLKPNRWISVVFQHWNTAYFNAILASAAESGADLRAAVSQVGDPIWSMHKKKGSESVLAGELILTFFNTGKPCRFDTDRPFDVEGAVAEQLRQANGGPIYGEQLLNSLIIAAWRKGAINSIGLSKHTLSEMLQTFGFTYDTSKHVWTQNRRASMLV